MEALRRFIIILAGLALAIGTSILVMVKGWGLEPRSWWWIIGASLLGHLVAQLFIEVGKSKD